MFETIAVVTFVDRGTDDDGWERDEWDVMLHHDGRKMRTKFYTGTLHGEPTTEDVLSSLISDAQSIEFENVDGWVESMGFEINSMADARKYERLYRQIEDQTKDLELLLGADYDRVAEKMANV